MLYSSAKRCLAFIFFIIAITPFSFSQNIDDIEINGNYQQIYLYRFLDQIAKEHNIKFFYKEEWLKNEVINYNFNDVPLKRVLDRITATQPLEYQIVDNNKVVFLPREKVTMLTGNRNESSSNYEGDIIPIGDPMLSGKFRKADIKGLIKDGKTGEPIIGANIQIENTSQGVSTNSDGFFKFNLTVGTYTLIVSSVGYETSKFKINLISPGKFEAELFEQSIKIEEISIFANRPDKNVRGNQMSLIDLDSKTIKQLPSLVGDKDIIKSFTMMPGVKSVGEFGSGINVRGGGEDQNLYLIEGAPIFNTAHVFGLLSVLNPDAVKNVTLYKGQIPANFGERVSSVMDIYIRDNNSKEFKGTGGIGLFNSRLLLEGPVMNENLTYKVGVRTSYSNYLLQQMKDYNLKNSRANFFDINALVNWKVKHDKVSVFFYNSADRFRYSNIQDFNYGNTIFSLNWNHFFNDGLSSLLTLAYSGYNASRDDINTEVEKKRYSTGIEYMSAKYNMKFTGFNKHTIDGGVQVIKYKSKPGTLEPLGNLSLIENEKISEENGIETAAFLSDVYDINEDFSISAGLRFSNYMAIGPKAVYQYNNDRPIVFPYSDSTYYGSGKIVKSYFGIEPRVSAKYMITRTTSIKASYNRSYQYIALLSYSALSMPTDYWKLSDTYMKPLQSDHYAIGIFRNNKINTLEASVEIYYKKLKNLAEYKTNATLEMQANTETELILANGTNYGIELMVKKNKGKIDGWISYTYSRSLRQTNGVYEDEMVNFNKEYPSAFDKPHDFTVSFNYHVNKRLRFGANFNYATGRPISYPEYSYSEGRNIVVFFSDRNKYRIPDYHRLDFSISLDESLRKLKKWKGSWTFSVLNVYGRKNAYSVFYKKEAPSNQNNYKTFTTYKMFIIGQPIPTLTYNFIF